MYIALKVISWIAKISLSRVKSTLQNYSSFSLYLSLFLSLLVLIHCSLVTLIWSQFSSSSENIYSLVGDFPLFLPSPSLGF